MEMSGELNAPVALTPVLSVQALAEYDFCFGSVWMLLNKNEFFPLPRIELRL
jgi:hypothetical protein